MRILSSSTLPHFLDAYPLPPGQHRREREERLRLLFPLTMSKSIYYFYHKSYQRNNITVDQAAHINHGHSSIYTAGNSKFI